jgi:hypothetical protein
MSTKVVHFEPRSSGVGTFSLREVFAVNEWFESVRVVLTVAASELQTARGAMRSFSRSLFELSFAHSAEVSRLLPSVTQRPRLPAAGGAAIAPAAGADVERLALARTRWATAMKSRVAAMGAAMSLAAEDNLPTPRTDDD